MTILIVDKSADYVSMNQVIFYKTSENNKKSKVTSFVLPNTQRYSVYYYNTTAKETNEHIEENTTREFSFMFLKPTKNDWLWLQGKITSELN